MKKVDWSVLEWRARLYLLAKLALDRAGAYPPTTGSQKLHEVLGTVRELKLSSWLCECSFNAIAGEKGFNIEEEHVMSQITKIPHGGLAKLAKSAVERDMLVISEVDL